MTSLGHSRSNWSQTTTCTPRRFTLQVQPQTIRDLRSTVWTLRFSPGTMTAEARRMTTRDIRDRRFVLRADGTLGRLRGSIVTLRFPPSYFTRPHKVAAYDVFDVAAVIVVILCPHLGIVVEELVVKHIDGQCG